MQHIHTDKAPAPLGPYSQATVANGMVFVAMQLAVQPDGTAGNEIPFADQAKQVFANITEILIAAGSSAKNTLQVKIYSTDLSQGAVLNKIYEEYFPAPNQPARTVIGVKDLHLGYKIAAEAVGVINEQSLQRHAL